LLPGVTTGDDFHSEFAVRSPFGNMNFTFDGIQTSFLLHRAARADGGSIAMVNGDILDGITLLNGSYHALRQSPRARSTFTCATGRGIARRSCGRQRHRRIRRRRGSARWQQGRMAGVGAHSRAALKQINEDDDDFGFGFSDVQSSSSTTCRARIA
jgi:hypothetical protein